MPETSEKHLLPSYGRQRGRKLRATKQGLVDGLLPQLDVADWGLGDREDALPPPQSLVPNPLWLEIGFGGGEHLAHQAKLHPEASIIGCEPYIHGIAGLLRQVQEHKLSNIRIFTQDARLLMARLPDHALARVFILYPDPWPKARHHKRRLISKIFLDHLARVMMSGAEVRLATDDEDYCTWMLQYLLAHPAFRWQAKNCDDWLTPPPDWISTRYEQKAFAAGRKATYLNFVRL